MNELRPGRRRRGGVTIQDVARLAGVSPMTVSRVMNDEKNVREATREAVIKAVRELNYAPNPAARSLARADPTHIGVLYSNPSAAYLSKFLLGALEEARQVGTQLVLDSSDEDAAEERAAAVRLAENGVDGVILPAPLSESAHVLEVFENADMPVVRVAVGRMTEPGLNVRVDDRAAAHAMARHLLDLGHRRIGFIRGHPNQSASEERWRGFADALEAAGTDPLTAAVEQGYFTYRSGFEATERLLATWPDLTAIFASNDDMAAAAVNVAHIRGLRVPHDLSVVGFDDTAIATTVWPELTTVRQPIELMAGAALELLLAELRARRSGETLAPADHVIEHALVIRDSAAASVDRVREKA